MLLAKLPGNSLSLGLCEPACHSHRIFTAPAPLAHVRSRNLKGYARIAQDLRAARRSRCQNQFHWSANRDSDGALSLLTVVGRHSSALTKCMREDKFLVNDLAKALRARFKGVPDV